MRPLPRREKQDRYPIGQPIHISPPHRDKEGRYPIGQPIRISPPHREKQDRNPIAKSIRINPAYEEVRSILEDTKTTLRLMQVQIDELMASTEKMARLVHYWNVTLPLQKNGGMVHESPQMKSDERHRMAGLKRMGIGDRVCKDL
ncbi:MAG: hypothetical protein LQ351_001470 [Letrouitia transgressa]|nr:MAG: hypothetical protein LQ351_001470 [Letrouitia transgressa]